MRTQIKYRPLQGFGDAGFGMGQKVYVLRFPVFALAAVKAVDSKLQADIATTSKRFAANAAAAKWCRHYVG